MTCFEFGAINLFVVSSDGEQIFYVTLGIFSGIFLSGFVVPTGRFLCNYNVDDDKHSYYP